MNGPIERAPDRPGPVEAQIQLERRLSRIRWFGVLLGIYLLSQATSGPPPLPSTAIVRGADAMILILAIGNLALGVMLRRRPTPGSLDRIGVAMFGLDCLVIVAIVWLFSYTPKDATWALLYVLPLEGALRYAMRGALAASAGLALSEIAREAYLAAEFPRVGYVIPDLAFRVGIGILIGAVAGLMARSLRQEARSLEALAADQAITLAALARKEAETRESYRLLRETDQQRRQVLAHLVSSQERERGQLASRVRDDPLQHVVAAGIRLRALRSRLVEPNERAMLEDVASVVDAAVSSLRSLLFELQPGSLDRKAIVATLRAYVEVIDPSATVSIESHLKTEPSSEAKAALYRIAQGAILNAGRHADASEIHVLLRPTAEGVYLRVADDGSGVAEGEPSFSPRRLSLGALQERAELAGGWFHLLSGPGSGTIVQCWVPSDRLISLDR